MKQGQRIHHWQWSTPVLSDPARTVMIYSLLCGVLFVFLWCVNFHRYSELLTGSELDLFPMFRTVHLLMASWIATSVWMEISGDSRGRVPRLVGDALALGILICLDLGVGWIHTIALW